MKRASLLLRVKNGRTRRGLTTQPSQTYNGTTNKLTGVNMKSNKAPVFDTKIVLSTEDDAFAVATLIHQLGYLPGVYFAKDGKYSVQFNQAKKVSA
jgi:hypothetical protein